MIKDNLITNNLIQMFEDLFSGKYDAYKFSIDLPDYCFTNKENFREICLNCPHHNEQMG